MNVLKGIFTGLLICIAATAFSQSISPRLKSSVVTDTTLTNAHTTSPVNTSLAAITFLPPVVCLSYGFASLNSPSLKQVDHFVYDDMQEDHPQFSAHIDNYLQFAPAAAVYGLNLAGIKGKHNFADRTALFLLSSAIMSSSVFLLKNSTNQLRPNGSNYNAFPSGHTATAFANAEFLSQEYSDVSIWYGIAGYATATATGVLRVYNNEHWFSNIIAGAGIGILSTKLSYIIYPYIKRTFSGTKPLKSVIVPSYQNGLSLTYCRQL